MMRVGRNALYYDDYLLAIGYFNRVIAAKPYLYEPYYYRGVAKFYLDDFGGAEKDCTLALERNAFREDIYRLRGLSLIRGGKTREAIEDYNRVISLGGGDQAVWYNRALCRVEQRDFSRALLELDTMLVKWKDYKDAYELKAQLLLEKKDTLAAEHFIDSLLPEKPMNAMLLGMKGFILLGRGDYSGAEMFLTRAIEQNPQETNLYLSRALCNYHLRRLYNSMADYDAALERDGENFFGHYNRGILCAEVGENNTAIEDFSFVIEKEPGNILAIYNRAILREKVGDFYGAIRDYSVVLKEHPRFWTGLERRAALYRRVGQVQRALNDERKLTIARLDDMFGQRKVSHRVTRKRKETSLENYDKIVVGDEGDTLSLKRYTSELRGRIQDRKVDENPLPMFALFPRGDISLSVGNAGGYLPLAEKWNGAHPQELPIVLAYAVRMNDSLSLEDIFKRLDAKGDGDKSLAKAFLLSGMKRYAESLALLDDLAEETGQYQALALLQRAYVRTMNIHLSARSVQASLSVEDGERAFPSFGRDDVLSSVSLLRSSLKDLEQALSLMPDNAYLLYDMACVYTEMRQTEEAIACYTKALMADHGLTAAYYNRGLLYLKGGRVEEGLRDLSVAGEGGVAKAYGLIKKYTRVKKAQAKDNK